MLGLLFSNRVFGTLDPTLNMADGLRRRFNASNKEPINNTSNDSSRSAVRGRSGSEGDDDADTYSRF